MVKKAIFSLLFLILIINFISSIDVNIVSPQQGDVEIEDRYPVESIKKTKILHV